jgi:hypothetical protein
VRRLTKIVTATTRRALLRWSFKVALAPVGTRHRLRPGMSIARKMARFADRECPLRTDPSVVS